MRISTSEGQSFWNSKFADGAVDVDMVPWDQFLAQFVPAAVPNTLTTVEGAPGAINSAQNNSPSNNLAPPSTHSALDPETEALLKVRRAYI